MTHATSKRRGHGGDSIYWDASRNRYIGAVDLGFSPAGTRIYKKLSGKTKVEVRDKLKELHQNVDAGLRPWRRYTVAAALEDWLAHGVDGLSAAAPNIALLPWSLSKGRAESDYNKYVAARSNGRLLCLDRHQTVRNPLGIGSSLEICDLLGPENERRLRTLHGY